MSDPAAIEPCLPWTQSIQAAEAHRHSEKAQESSTKAHAKIAKK